MPWSGQCRSLGTSSAGGRQNEPTEVSLREAHSHGKTAKNSQRLIAEHCVGHLVSEDDLDDDFLDENVLNIEEKATWKMYFDGASNQHEYGVGVLLIAPDGVHIPLSAKLLCGCQQCRRI